MIGQRFSSLQRVYTVNTGCSLGGGELLVVVVLDATDGLDRWRVDSLCQGVEAHGYLLETRCAEVVVPLLSRRERKAGTRTGRGERAPSPPASL